VVKRLLKLRWLRISAFAAGSVAIAGSAAWVTASAAGFNVSLRSPAPSQAAAASVSGQASKSSAVCTDFLGHFAADLGSDQTKVSAALQKAIGQTLDDEVKNKDITQAQADAIKKQMAGKAPCDLISAPRLNVPGGSPAARIGAYQQALLSAAASALGITDAQLKTDLSQGMSLSQIAAAQKPPVTEAEFRARLIAKLTPLLDKAVTAKQLTSAQEQAIIKQLQTGPIPYWDKPLKKKTVPPAPVSSTTTT
jgi:hypothetical protein